MSNDDLMKLAEQCGAQQCGEQGEYLGFPSFEALTAFAAALRADVPALPPASEAPAVPETSLPIPFAYQGKEKGAWLHGYACGLDALKLAAPRPEAPTQAEGELQRDVIARTMLRLYKADPDATLVIGDLLAYLDTDRAARASDAEDAANYRWLRYRLGTAETEGMGTGVKMDRFIAAARAAQKKDSNRG